MKKQIIFSLIIGIIFSFASPLAAQKSDKEVMKDLKAKPVKTVRKEAKKYKKEGWYVAPGALPIEKQLENAWIKQYEEDDQGYPKYILASGNSVAESQTAAKLQASETAKLNIAGQIGTEVAALIENNIANQQLNTEEAASVTKTVAAAKNLIAQEIGRVIPLVEMYKKIGKNVECNVQIAYNFELAKEAAKKVIRQKLEEDTDLLQDKLEKLMKF